MSARGGTAGPSWAACRDRSHRWRVRVRQGNYSAFNGRRFTPSAYSLVTCLDCPRSWRTRAAYVAGLVDLSAAEHVARRAGGGL